MMIPIQCAKDYCDCQCDECIQKRDASARAPNALPGIISQILRENAQLNTQVTELQQKCTAQLEELRTLRPETKSWDWREEYLKERAEFKKLSRYMWEKVGDLHAGKFTNLIAQRLGKQRAMNRALRLDIEELKAKLKTEEDVILRCVPDDDDTVCADHE